MKIKQRELKTKLKLKRLTIKINEIVNWNFGYCPALNPYFDKILNERDYYLDIAKNEFPDVYDWYLSVYNN